MQNRQRKNGAGAALLFSILFVSSGCLQQTTSVDPHIDPQVDIPAPEKSSVEVPTTISERWPAWVDTNALNTGKDLVSRPVPQRFPVPEGLAIVFEGLPRFSKHEIENASSDTLSIGEFTFYAAPISLSPVDDNQIRDVLGSVKSFTKWRGEKLCGGFHPDWAIEYQGGEVGIIYLVCFGCDEVKILTDEGNRFRLDVKKEPYTILQNTLNEYHVNVRKES